MAAPGLTDDIQRVLYLGKVHCYAIPPLQANKGYKAADWNITDPKSIIFTARVRVIETSSQDGANVQTNIRLEDAGTGELFANGPYEGSYCVTPVLDSSRFFALRVVDGQRRAYLGIGFEERSDAFDFGVCLQEIRRQNNLDGEGTQSQQAAVAAKKKAEEVQNKDYSLKEGETINITIGNKGRRRPPTAETESTTSSNNASMTLPFLPPPPSAEDVKKKLHSNNTTSSHSLSHSNTNNDFDDDPFGDFQ